MPQAIPHKCSTLFTDAYRKKTILFHNSSLQSTHIFYIWTSLRSRASKGVGDREEGKKGGGLGREGWINGTVIYTILAFLKAQKILGNSIQFNFIIHTLKNIYIIYSKVGIHQ